jgi:hypothetical protein
VFVDLHQQSASSTLTLASVDNPTVRMSLFALIFLLLLALESFSLFVSLVYCAESTVRWFVVREKHCWMVADSADKSKRTGRLSLSRIIVLVLHHTPII